MIATELLSKIYKLMTEEQKLKLAGGIVDQVETAKPVICPECGAENQPGNTVCSSCRQRM
ncbi:MAG: hypothetical protein SCH71_04415 [Desulfobulbaceae bacterium]|nr:hypothetical protein [Desulfobulbaceae bacterium]